jgi:IclR family acetate operon transcriptional repressor
MPTTVRHETRGRGVLEGAFALLDYLPDTAPPHQLRDLAELSGVPRPTVYRLLDQLHDIGVVELVDGRYILGRAMLTMARRVEPSSGLRHAAAPIMDALRQRTGGTVSLIGRSETSATVLDSIPGLEHLPVDIFEGRMLPVHAAGSLVIDPSAAPERVDQTRRAAVDDQAVIEGLSCFAVAIALPDGSSAALQVASIPAAPAVNYSSDVQFAAARIRQVLRR